MGGVSATSLAPVTSFSVCAQNGVKPVRGNWAEVRVTWDGKTMHSALILVSHSPESYSEAGESHLWDICCLSSGVGG